MSGDGQTSSRVDDGCSASNVTSEANDGADIFSHQSRGHNHRVRLSAPNSDEDGVSGREMRPTAGGKSNSSGNIGATSGRTAIPGMGV